MNEELKLIKKHYGEKMMHLCRTLFPTILEEENKLLRLLLNNFEPNHFLYEDLDVYSLTNEFKSYIYSLTKEKEKPVNVFKTPEELMSEAGYDLYVCKSEKDIEAFKKYYRRDEQLCTFNGNRLDRCHVFFAVKKDIETIKRENFKEPERQDEYGTSVISIQFTKDESHTLSIKNRYNHHVDNPDATFSNNLENIIPGLTASFEDHYSLKQSEINEFEIPNYVKAKDGKYYRYNYEINNIYYCPNNIILDNFTPRRLVKDKYILIDYFILDLQNKEIKLYDKNIKESFHKILSDIKKIEIAKSSFKTIILQSDIGKTNLKIDDSNKIIEIISDDIISVEDNFLSKNTSLKMLSLSNLEKTGHFFLENNSKIEEINLPKLKVVGSVFLRRNQSLKTLSLPNLEKVGNYILDGNEKIEEVYLPKLREIGSDFLCKNTSLKTLSLPNLEAIPERFLISNKAITEVSLPKLTYAGLGFMYSNTSLKTLSLPSLEIIKGSFLPDNEKIEEVYLPKLKEIDSDFLSSNTSLKTLSLPNLKTVGNNFLSINNEIKEIDLPNLIETGSSFLSFNKSLKTLNLPKLEYAGSTFLYQNETIEDINLPNLIEMGANCLYENKSLTTLSLPNLEKVGFNFLRENETIKEIDLPKLESLPLGFLSRNSAYHKMINTGGKSI
jgi:hypothetical protein